MSLIFPLCMHATNIYCGLGKVINFRLFQLFQTISEHSIYRRWCNRLFFKKICHGIIFTTNFSFDCLDLCHSNERYFEKHKSPWLYHFKPFLRQKFYLPFPNCLLSLSAAFWMGLPCFCWTSGPLGTKADMKLSL